MTVSKIRVSSKVTDSKVELWILKTNFLIWDQSRVGANSEPVCYLSTLSQFGNFQKIFKLGTPKLGFAHVTKLGMYDSGLQGVPKLKLFGKLLIWGALWRSVPRFIIFWKFLNWFSKKNLNSPKRIWMALSSRNPAAQVPSKPGLLVVSIGT